MGQVIHSNCCQMGGNDGWPWNSRSHDLASELKYLSHHICWRSWDRQGL